MGLAGSLMAEFIGIFALVFIGAGSIVAANIGGGGLVTIALAHGLIIAVMAATFGRISGGHFNPAVTWGTFLSGDTNFGKVVTYVPAQLLGAVAGSWVLGAIFPTDIWQAAGFGIPQVAHISAFAAIFVEAVLTGFLLFAVLATNEDKRDPNMGALFIGLTITLGILMAGPFTGGAMNPARAFGPAFAASGILEGAWSHWYVYLVGPMVGSTVAAVLYKIIGLLLLIVPARKA